MSLIISYTSDSEGVELKLYSWWWYNLEIFGQDVDDQAGLKFEIISFSRHAPTYQPFTQEEYRKTLMDSSQVNWATDDDSIPALYATKITLKSYKHFLHQTWINWSECNALSQSWDSCSCHWFKSWSLQWETEV